MPDKNQTYREKNGTTRVGDTLGWLVDSGRKIAPEILELAGNITGIDALEKLGEKIRGDQHLSETDKMLLLAELEYDKVMMQEVSKRWQADMESDSWASKNIRPLATVGTLAFTFIIIILDSSISGFKVADHWVELLVPVLMLMIGAYFGGRTYEKAKKVAGKIKE
jgi:hypothetical protein